MMGNGTDKANRSSRTWPGLDNNNHTLSYSPHRLPGQIKKTKKSAHSNGPAHLFFIFAPIPYPIHTSPMVKNAWALNLVSFAPFFDPPPFPFPFSFLSPPRPPPSSSILFLSPFFPFLSFIAFIFPGLL
ncbi:MAG: hypothetical protein JOS17DRAFT_218400 [Linnemannia elongata]|nr:MAG: hypothetical protein JOS17DRAFT_218400 [Linnemannia elongata]